MCTCMPVLSCEVCIALIGYDFDVYESDEVQEAETEVKALQRLYSLVGFTWCLNMPSPRRCACATDVLGPVMQLSSILFVVCLGCSHVVGLSTATTLPRHKYLKHLCGMLRNVWHAGCL